MTRPLSFLRRRGVIAPASVVVGAMTVAAGAASTDVAAAPLTMTGRAYVASVSLFNKAPTTLVDTGEVSSTGQKTVDKNVTAVPGPPLAIQVADANVATNVDRSLAEADAAGVALGSITTPTGIPGLPPMIIVSGIIVGAVSAQSSISCETHSGITNIAFLQIGTNKIVTGAKTPAANTTIPLGAGNFVVLNEQKFVTGATGTAFTVNAVHVHISGVVDLVVASARSDIHNCGRINPT